jgi:hypothetical protein
MKKSRRDFLKLSGRLAVIWGVSPMGLVRLPDQEPVQEKESQDTEDRFIEKVELFHPYCLLPEPETWIYARVTLSDGSIEIHPAVE